jgi:hypothetical protein
VIAGLAAVICFLVYRWYHILPRDRVFVEIELLDRAILDYEKEYGSLPVEINKDVAIYLKVKGGLPIEFSSANVVIFRGRKFRYNPKNPWRWQVDDRW